MPTTLTRVNGQDLNVLQRGSGQAVLLLHGLSANLTSQLPEINALSPDFRVVAYDARGHGRSSKPLRYTLSDHVNDAVALLDALEIEQAHVVGTSMGSYVAQGIVTRAPQRVNKLVLVVPKASGKTSSSARLQAQYAAQLAGKTPEEARGFMMNLIFAPETPQAVRQAFFEQALEEERAGSMLTPAQVEAANAALEGFDFRPQLPQVTAPTLIISGQHDPLNPPEQGREIAQLVPGAHFEVLEHSGHLPSVEQPQEYAALLRHFLLS